MGGSRTSDIERAVTVVNGLEATATALRQEAAALREAISSALRADGRPRAISVPEAAQRMGIGTRTLARMIAEGEIESTKIGARRLVPLYVIDAYLSAKTGAA